MLRCAFCDEHEAGERREAAHHVLGVAVVAAGIPDDAQPMQDLLQRWCHFLHGACASLAGDAVNRSCTGVQSEPFVCGRHWVIGLSRERYSVTHASADCLLECCLHGQRTQAEDADLC